MPGRNLFIWPETGFNAAYALSKGSDERTVRFGTLEQSGQLLRLAQPKVTGIILS